MRILVVGDAHLKTVAANRSDVIWETQKKKLREVFEIAQAEKVEAIVQAGDLFNSASVPHEIVSELIELLNDVHDAWQGTPPPLLGILGQHDKYMRTGLKRSPARTIAAAGRWNQLNEVPWIQGAVAFYGADFGEPIPSAAGRSTGFKRVLVIHAPISPEPRFPGDTDYIRPLELLRGPEAREYDLIICGDYHYPFFLERTKKFPAVLNTGALTRQTIADKDQMPEVVVYDLQSGKLEKFRLKSAAKNPFGSAQKAKVDSEALHQLVERLKAAKVGDLNFIGALMAAMDRERIADSARAMIERAMEATTE